MAKREEDQEREDMWDKQGPEPRPWSHIKNLIFSIPREEYLTFYLDPEEILPLFWFHNDKYTV